MSKADRLTRPPAVAGILYPADAATLAASVDGLLDRVKVAAEEPLAPAYLLPHGDLATAGSTIAEVYGRLRAHADRIDRIVILGPGHQAVGGACLVSSAARWATPLGEVPVDLARAVSLIADGNATADSLAHGPEHSIEVQLPFLQRSVRPSTTIVPLLVGAVGANDVAVTIAAVRGPTGRGTVVLCSADLTHYLDYATAVRHDGRTAAAIVSLATERVGTRDTCAVDALRGLLSWARHERLHPKLLQLTNSAAQGGRNDRVVGYASVAFHRGSF